MAAKIKILVVDDDLKILHGTSMLLKREGYFVLEARTGEEAIQSAKENIPDIILLDVVLPDIEGFEVCRQLKKKERTSRIHIIFITGKRLAVADMSLGLELGANDYILRPIENRELLTRITTLSKLIGAENELINQGIDLEELISIRTTELKTEIALREQMQEKIQKSERNILNLVENSPDLIARFDSNLRHVYINPSITKATGLPLEEFVGKSNCDLGMPEKLTGLWDTSIRTVFETGREKEIEFSYQTPDGEKYFQSRIVPEFAEDEKVNTVLGVTRDITELKIAELTTRESEQRLKLALKATSLGLWDWNISTGKFLGDERWAGVLGYTLDEVTADPNLWQSHVHPEDLKTGLKIWKQFLSGEIKAYEDEYRVQHRTGMWLWVAAYGKIVERDQENKPVRIIGTVQDITERKKAEQALIQEKEKLESALAEIKTLSGLLPFCSYCKKIRDDKGYWNQIDAYIEEHSEADISHSICPECAEKNYPDMGLYDDE